MEQKTQSQNIHFEYIPPQKSIDSIFEATKLRDELAAIKKIFNTLLVDSSNALSDARYGMAYSSLVMLDDAIRVFLNESKAIVALCTNKDVSLKEKSFAIATLMGKIKEIKNENDATQEKILIDCTNRNGDNRSIIDLIRYDEAIGQLVADEMRLEKLLIAHTTQLTKKIDTISTSLLKKIETLAPQFDTILRSWKNVNAHCVTIIENIQKSMIQKNDYSIAEIKIKRALEFIHLNRMFCTVTCNIFTCLQKIPTLTDLSTEDMEECAALVDNQKKIILGTNTLVDTAQKTIETSLKLCPCCSQAASLTCGKCKKVRYCSKECQKKDWTAHRNTCSIVDTSRVFFFDNPEDQACYDQDGNRYPMTYSKQDDDNIISFRDTSNQDIFLISKVSNCWVAIRVKDCAMFDIRSTRPVAPFIYQAF